MNIQRIYPIVMVTLFCSGSVFADDLGRVNGQNSEQTDEELLQGLRPPVSLEADQPDLDKNRENFTKSKTTSSSEEDLLAELGSEKQDPQNAQEQLEDTHRSPVTLKKLLQQYPYAEVVGAPASVDRKTEEVAAYNAMLIREANNVSELALAGNVNAAVRLLNTHTEADFVKIKSLAVKNIDFYSRQIARRNADEEFMELYSYVHDTRQAINQAVYDSNAGSFGERIAKNKDIAIAGALTPVGIYGLVALSQWWKA